MSVPFGKGAGLVAKSYDGMRDSKSLDCLSAPWSNSIGATIPAKVVLTQKQKDNATLDDAPVVYCTGWTPPKNN